MENPEKKKDTNSFVSKLCMFVFLELNSLLFAFVIHSQSAFSS